MAKQRIYENMEDNSPENFAKGFPVREACLEHEDKFDLLSETEKKKRQEEDIQVEEADRAGTRNNSEGNHYDWRGLQLTGNCHLLPYVEAVLNQHATRHGEKK
jgi:hypothetical protein